MAGRRIAARALPRVAARVRPRSATDERLVTLVRRGDLGAFEALYDRHARELLAFCVYILGSRDDAEDALQSTFASAYRALLADQREVDLRPWLFSIARNAALTILRKRRETSEIHDVAAYGEDPATRAEQRESLREVLATVRELPERQRTALVLAELHGLSHTEIGTVLEVAPEKVKSYVYQARSSLLSERSAREVDCAEIRGELAEARGAALLRARLRRHLRSCEGCREYAAELSTRRGRLGALFPLLPTVALKRRVLDAVSGDAANAGAFAGGSLAGVSAVGVGTELAGAGAKVLVTKLLVGVAGVALGTGAGTLALSAAATTGRQAGAHSTNALVRTPARRDGAASRSQGEVPAGSAPVKGTPSFSGASGLTDAPRSRANRPSVPRAAGHAGVAGVQAGKSAEAHGKSTEAHGSSAEAHGKSEESHGKSEEAHARGVGRPGAMGKGGLGHGNSEAAHGKSGAGRQDGSAPGAGAKSHAGGAASAPGAQHAPRGATDSGSAADLGTGGSAVNKSTSAPNEGSPTHGRPPTPQPAAPLDSGAAPGASSEKGASAQGAHGASAAYAQTP